MSELLKRLLKLNISPEEQRVLDALNASTITSRKVVGRGTLTVNVKDITSSEKFREYSIKATRIVSYQR